METDNAVSRETAKGPTTKKKKNLLSFFSSNTSNEKNNGLHWEDIALEWLQNNMMAVGAIVGVVLLGAGVFGVVSHFKGERVETETKLAYEFREASLVPFTQKKMSATDLLRSYAEFQGKAKESSVTAPLAMAVQKELAEQGLYKEARDVLLPLKDKVGGNALYRFLILSQLAALSEDLGENEQAIQYLEELLKMPQKYLEAKIYLDLGRNYLRLGNNEKAKSNLEYVVQNFFNDDLAKVAKLYLAKMDKK